ncbi:prepilin peptidase [Galenea microaerophila]
MFSELHALSPLALALVGTALGLIVGSFISMLSYRLPKVVLEEASVSELLLKKGRSHCPQCDTPLPWYRLIPLLSWLASAGKCHQCNTPISKRYPLIELFSALSTAYILWHFGFSEKGMAALIFNWFLLTISVIDIEHQLILDVLSLPLLWIGLLINTQGLFTSPESAIWGAAMGYLILWLLFQSFKALTGKEGMGYGDFKLLAALGAWFGFDALPLIILIAALGTIVIGLLGGLLRIRSLNEPMPFGPFLALGGWIFLFFGNILNV